MTRFRELRLQHGLTQTRFRQLYNEKYNRSYTAAAISQIEHGKRMLELGALLDFADFYGVSVDYLLGKGTGIVTGDGGERQLSNQLEKLAEQVLSRNLSESDDETKENVEVLQCLLRQSVIFAKRVEKEEKAWYRV